jgi:hypothetical protein
VDPAIGFGTDEDVDDCPPSQQREIQLFPVEPRYNINMAIACVGSP